jgi:hypothetical protein
MPAAGASDLSAFSREIFVKFQKERVKAGIGEQGLVQRIASFTLASKGDKKPLREASVKLFEGVSSFPSDYLIKFPDEPINYCAHAYGQ